jgi:hypothetical protein
MHVSATIEGMLNRFLRINPCVTIHELRMRMRGPRPFWMMLGYALIATVSVLLTLGIILLEDRLRSPTMGFYGERTSDTGHTAFMVLTFVQLSLIALLMPAYSAGAITMEREKRTLDMVRATLLSPFDVVSGKLVVVMGFAGLLLLTTLPVAAWCVMMGGLGPAQVAQVYIYLFVFSLELSALGFVSSAIFQRSIAAIGAVYVTIALVFAGGPIVYMAVTEAIPHTGSGIISLIVTVVMWGATAALLLFLAILAGLRLRLRRRWRIGAAVLAVVIAALLVSGIAALAFGIGTVVPIPSDQTLPLLAHPIGALMLVLDPESVTSSLGVSSASAPAAFDIVPYLWPGTTALALMAGVILWFFAVAAYRRFQ